MAKKPKHDVELDAYHELIAAKSRYDYAAGFECDAQWLHMFPFQRDLTRWALRKGRAALFVDTGLGKTRMQCTFANEALRHIGNDSQGLILAPLAVAQQTIAEAASCGIDVRYVRDQSAVRPGISIANYEMLHALDTSKFAVVALDESSILKNFTGATRTALIESFARTPYRLACTATPSPNDFTELGNHAQFLGVMSREEMLAMYFVHDGGDTSEWRLKGHARDKFWQWVCSWAAMVRRPSDLGYSDDGYILPPLEIHEHIIPATAEQAKAQGMLIVQVAKGLNEQRKAKRATLDDRVALAAKLASESDEQFLIWCQLNDESEAVTELICGAVEVTGSQSPEEKAAHLHSFARGGIVKMVTKSSIAGMGLNFQGCHRQIFVGPSNSFEEWYQSVRRSYRFGQTHTVRIDVISSELEGAVLANLKRKQVEAEKMSTEMSAFTREYVQANVKSTARDTTGYNPTVPMTLPSWLQGST
jgi:superfamily II DNA or RNA helicase